MEKTIERICGMLQGVDGMRRCAAAMVLTELAPKDAVVVKALGETLKDANQLLTRYVLEAFEAIGTRAVVPYVLPLLDAPDMETKLRAAAIIARAGGDSVAELKRRFETAAPEQKQVLIDILARIHRPDAMNLLLEALFDTNFELVKETCQAVRRHIGDATPAERSALHKLVVKFMKSSRAKKNDRVTTSSLLLLGYLGRPEARALLLQFAGPRTLPYIRRNALLALRSLEITGSAATNLARQLVKYLDDAEFANVVQPSLDIIEKLTLPASFDGQWRKLLKGKHPAVRAFAARRLAATDSAAGNRLLMTLLAHDDPQVSEIAAGALARHKGAGKLLLDALARERRADPAWRLAKILKPHSESADKKVVKKFSALAIRDLQKGEPRAEALLYFLRNINPQVADAVWRDAGLQFKKAGKWAKAVECLRQLTSGDAFDNELRYELSVCNLKQSPRDLAPHLRAEDHALRGFQALADKGFKLADRLLKEKAVEPAELYYVGFHFAEGAGDGQVKFGEKLLEHVAKRWAKSKVGKDAKSKLKLIQAPAATQAV
jgi:HEAT repeat protein